MKQFRLKIISQLLLIVLLSFTLIAQSQLEQRLESLEGITNVTQIEGDSIYSEIFEVYIDQPVDHNNPEGDHFTQKFYIGHIDDDVLVMNRADVIDGSIEDDYIKISIDLPI